MQVDRREVEGGSLPDCFSGTLSCGLKWNLFCATIVLLFTSPWDISSWVLSSLSTPSWELSCLVCFMVVLFAFVHYNSI